MKLIIKTVSCYFANKGTRFYTCTHAGRTTFVATAKTTLRNMVNEFLSHRTGTEVSGNMFAYGNTKLGPEILNINQESAHNCSSDKKGFCAVSKICYAKKNERIYKTYREANQRREAFFAHAQVSDILFLIDTFFLLAPEKIKAVRLNEAGDFTSQTAVKMWDYIAKQITAKYNVITYAYTARKDLDFNGVSFRVIGSSEEIKGAHAYFIARPKAEAEAARKAGEKVCKGSCKKCALCRSPKVTGKIICAYH